MASNQANERNKRATGLERARGIFSKLGSNDLQAHSNKAMLNRWFQRHCAFEYKILVCN